MQAHFAHSTCPHPLGKRQKEDIQVFPAHLETLDRIRARRAPDKSNLRVEFAHYDWLFGDAFRCVSFVFYHAGAGAGIEHHIVGSCCVKMASTSATEKSRTDSTRQNIVFFHPDLGIGGAERLIIDAAVGLQDLGHKVVIYTSHCDPRHCFDEARDGELLTACGKVGH